LVLVAALAAIASLALPGPALAAGDGSLKRIPGKAGCLSLRGANGCTPARGLAGANSLALSPGGGNVYVASIVSDAVAVFRRDARRGTLRQPRGRAGCLSLTGGRRCGRVRGLREPFAIVVSPDGRHVYVGAAPGRIFAFARSRRTGALRRLDGKAGCVSDSPGAGCGRARALSGVSSLAIGPQGRFLYAGTTKGVAVLRRKVRTGRLVQLRGPNGCVTVQDCGSDRAQVYDVALDPRARNLYATTAAVAVFRQGGGVVRQLAGAAGCVSHLGEGGCTAANSLLGPYALAVSPNGAQVYVTATGSGAIGVLARDSRTGALSQPAGPLGCIRDGGGFGCASARYLNELDELALSPDGRNAYVTALGKLIVLRRDRATGALSQLPGRAGCVAPVPPYVDCTSDRGLDAVTIAISPDGRHAYATSDGGAIVAYRRAR
jgi:DNA-binding beta-propeller fold protein YncE